MWKHIEEQYKLRVFYAIYIYKYIIVLIFRVDFVVGLFV